MTVCRRLLAGAVLLLGPSGCQTSDQPASARAAMMQDLARKAVATGRAADDQERLRQLAGHLVTVVGEQAGFYQRCSDAPPRAYQQTLATVLAEDPPPPKTMNHLGTDFGRGFQHGQGLPCGDHGIAEELQERRQATEAAYSFFRCTMPWHYGGTWTPNSAGALRGHGVSYREFMTRCGIG